MIVRSSLLLLLSSSPATTHRVVSIFRARRDALLYAHGNPRGWRMAGDIKLPTFDRISDCTEGEGGWIPRGGGGGLNGIPLEASRGPQTKRKGLYILCRYPFRGRSIRLRGKISIRNDIERLIRKGWNPLCLELDSVSPPPATMIIFFFFFFFFLFSLLWDPNKYRRFEMVAAMINAFICVGIVLITVFVPLFFSEFVKVLKNKRSNVSLIFKLEVGWIGI